jgi:hypothetical protein
MRIVLDTDKKTITVPYNYSEKLEAINQMGHELAGEGYKDKSWTGYLDEIWKYCIENSDKCLKTGKKPAAAKKGE